MTQEPQKIGFIGLGIMGTPMCRHLVDAGHQLFVFTHGKVPEQIALTKTIIGTVGLGGYGFLLMFYLAGVAGVPRRYAIYPPEVAVGTAYAKISLIFIAVLLIGALIYIWETGRRCLKVFSS